MRLLVYVLLGTSIICGLLTLTHQQHKGKNFATTIACLILAWAIGDHYL